MSPGYDYKMWFFWTLMLMLTTAKPRTFVRAIFIQMLSGRTVTVDFFLCFLLWHVKECHQCPTTCSWFPWPRGWVGIWSALLCRICCDGQAVAGQECILHGLQCTFWEYEHFILCFNSKCKCSTDLMLVVPLPGGAEVDTSPAGEGAYAGRCHPHRRHAII